MATEMLLKRMGKHLVAAESTTEEAIAAMSDKEVVTATIRRSRNPQHHRLFFALLQAVYENQSRYPTIEHLLDAIKIFTGHYDILKIDGERREVIKTRSISFGKMDQKSFSEFYDKVVQLICEKILPGVKSVELERRIQEIL